MSNTLSKTKTCISSCETHMLTIFGPFLETAEYNISFHVNVLNYTTPNFGQFLTTLTIPIERNATAILSTSNASLFLLLFRYNRIMLTLVSLRVVLDSGCDKYKRSSARYFLTSFFSVNYLDGRLLALRNFSAPSDCL